MVISIKCFSQWPCNHLDCARFLPEGISKEDISLDSTYMYSTLLDTSEFHTKYNKNKSWKWKSNYRVNSYSVNNSSFCTDTIELSEGFIYNSKRNDYWKIYYYPSGFNSYGWYSIGVSETFYLNDNSIINICGSSMINRELINADFTKSEAIIRYPLYFLNKEQEIDTTIYFMINCKIDFNGNVTCIATTEDKEELLNVPAKYLEDELIVSAESKIRNIIYRSLLKQRK